MAGVTRVVMVGLGLAVELMLGTAQAATPSAPGAEVSIVSPHDGDTVTSPVKVQFGAKGMAIVKAGDMKENSGHHHLIVDADVPPADQPIGKDAQHMHFGGGQTEAMVELPKGKHTLQLVLGDAAHVPHHPMVVSKKITIEVK